MCVCVCVFVCVCVLLFIFVTDSLTGSQQYAIAGSLFTFTCNIYKPYHDDVTWHENYQTYIISEDRYRYRYYRRPLPAGYTFRKYGRISTLTINPVNISQDGRVWRCGRGSLSSNKIVLKVRGNILLSFLAF